MSSIRDQTPPGSAPGQIGRSPQQFAQARPNASYLDHASPRTPPTPPGRGAVHRATGDYTAGPPPQSYNLATGQSLGTAQSLGPAQATPAMPVSGIVPSTGDQLNYRLGSTSSVGRTTATRTTGQLGGNAAALGRLLHPDQALRTQEPPSSIENMYAGLDGQQPLAAPIPHSDSALANGSPVDPNQTIFFSQQPPINPPRVAPGGGPPSIGAGGGMPPITESPALSKRAYQDADAYPYGMDSDTAAQMGVSPLATLPGGTPTVFGVVLSRLTGIRPDSSLFGTKISLKIYATEGAPGRGGGGGRVLAQTSSHKIGIDRGGAITPREDESSGMVDFKQEHLRVPVVGEQPVSLVVEEEG